MTAGKPTELDGRTIREATTDDLAALAALEAESFAEGSWSRGLLADGLAAAGALWLVAPGGGPKSPIHAYAAFQRAADEAELLSVAVAPSQRRRGLGTALIVAGLERLRAAGVCACYLEVAVDNHPAIALYRRLGFEQVGKRPHYYGRGRDALLLRADLADRPPSRSGAPPTAQEPSLGGVTSKPG